jgi:heptosyltransferase II
MRPTKLNRAVVVFRSAALGDFILACPALRLMRRAFPDTKIVLVTTQSASREQRKRVARYAGTTSSIPWVDLARPHLVDDVVVIEDVKSIAGLAAARRQLRNYRIDCCVLLLEPATPWMSRLKKIGLMFLLAGPVPQYGWRGPGYFFRDKARLYRRGLLQHHVQSAMQFVDELPTKRYRPAKEVIFDLRPGETANIWADMWIRDHALLERRLIAVVPGSIQPHKRWPTEKFQRLCEMLLTDDPNAVLIVLGTALDAKIGVDIARHDPNRVINLAGETSIAQSAALLARCALVVGNDGGAMHLGDAMGARVVSIVPGLEYPDSIEPWNNKSLAVRHPVECAPCYSFLNCPLGHNKCMVELPVADVLANSRAALCVQSSSE